MLVMPPEHITTIIIRQYILTDMDTRLLLMDILTVVKQGTLRTKVNIGIMVGIITILIMTVLMVVSTTGTGTIGMLGDPTTQVTDTGLTTPHMHIKNQTDMVVRLNLTEMGIIIVTFIMALLVVMMDMSMLTLDYHTIAILMHIILVQVLTTTTTLQAVLTQMLLHTMQEALVE